MVGCFKGTFYYSSNIGHICIVEVNKVDETPIYGCLVINKNYETSSQNLTGMQISNSEYFYQITINQFNKVFKCAMFKRNWKELKEMLCIKCELARAKIQIAFMRIGGHSHHDIAKALTNKYGETYIFDDHKKQILRINSTPPYEPYIVWAC